MPLSPRVSYSRRTALLRAWKPERALFCKGQRRRAGMVSAVVIMFCFMLCLTTVVDARKKGRTKRPYNVFACVHDMVSLCSHVVPGDGRMDECLYLNSRALSEPCRDRRTMWREKAPDQCQTDVQAHCRGVSMSGVTRCLRNHHARLSAKCKTALPIRPTFYPINQQFASKTVDSGCADAIMKTCKGASTGGAVVECVQASSPSMDRNCRIATDRNKAGKLSQGSIPDSCNADLVKFCRGQKTDGDNLLYCLQSNARDLRRQCSVDLRLLAFELPLSCSKDTLEYCSYALASKEDLVECLERRQQNLSKGCSLRRIKGLTTIPHHTTNQDSCGPDVRQFCVGVAPGGGRLLKCLSRHIERLSDECLDIITPSRFKTMQRDMSEDQKGSGGQNGKLKVNRTAVIEQHLANNVKQITSQMHEEFQSRAANTDERVVAPTDGGNTEGEDDGKTVTSKKSRAAGATKPISTNMTFWQSFFAALLSVEALGFLVLFVGGLLALLLYATPRSKRKSSKAKSKRS